MNIPEGIKRARQLRGITQRELAEKSGFSLTAISHWEVGDRQPKGSSLKKMASVLGCSIDYLVMRSDDPTPILVESNRLAFIDEVMKMPDQDLERLIKYYELIKAASGGVADGSL